MAEIPSPFGYEQGFQRIESRFGDPKKIVEIMLSGEVQILGSIDDIYADTPEHINQVDIGDIQSEHANQILGVRVQSGEDTIRCVFKPAKGENAKVKQDTTVKSFYPRECAAYAISEHFDFDLVPPTVIREVDGEIGALQLFMDPEYYRNYSRLDDTEQTRSGADWQIMAALDWILANCERHANNMMVDTEHPDRMIAIDHGIILNPHNYFEQALRGPMVQLTQERINTGAKVVEKPKQVQIPSELIGLISDAISRKDELTTKLLELEGIEQTEIDLMWKRAEELIEYGTFLSRYNYEAVTGKSFLGQY